MTRDRDRLERATREAITGRQIGALSGQNSVQRARQPVEILKRPFERKNDRFRRETVVENLDVRVEAPKRPFQRAITRRNRKTAVVAQKRPAKSRNGEKNRVHTVCGTKNPSPPAKQPEKFIETPLK